MQLTGDVHFSGSNYNVYSRNLWLVVTAFRYLIRADRVYCLWIMKHPGIVFDAIYLNYLWKIVIVFFVQRSPLSSINHIVIVLYECSKLILALILGTFIKKMMIGGIRKCIFHMFFKYFDTANFITKILLHLPMS